MGGALFLQQEAPAEAPRPRARGRRVNGTSDEEWRAVIRTLSGRALVA